MSDAHKEALARGRREARAIKSYLEALGKRRPGRPVTPETIKARIARLEGQIAAEGDPLRRVELVQKRMDAEESLEHANAVADLESLEAGFVEHALAYSERKGITYTAWREAGVPADVLRSARIPRTRRA